jgi:Zn-dependent peptidase ImmA (M78 family)
MQKGHEKKQIESSELYSLARETALQKRAHFGVCTCDINIPLLKKICRLEGIKVDMTEKIGSTIRAAYFFDEDGCSILLRKDLPREPKLFALAHELKHHFLDRQLIADGQMRCGAYNANKEIEIAAEVFAAEFIFPEEEMRLMVQKMKIKQDSCRKEDLVEIKRCSPVPVSYAFIRKRLTWFGIIQRNQFDDIQFQKLEESLYPPLYKQKWFKEQRAMKAAAKKSLESS